MSCNALCLCNYAFLPAIIAIKELLPVFKIARKLSWTISPQNTVCILFPYSGGILITLWKSVILPRAFYFSLALLQLTMSSYSTIYLQNTMYDTIKFKIHLCLPQVLSN